MVRQLVLFYIGLFGSQTDSLMLNKISSSMTLELELFILRLGRFLLVSLAKVSRFNSLSDFLVV